MINYFNPDIFTTLFKRPAFIKIWNFFQIDLTIILTPFNYFFSETIMWHLCYRIKQNISEVKIYLLEGNVNQKVEPLCIPEETPTSPFKLFTKFFTIAKPRPLPLLCEALADAAL